MRHTIIDSDQSSYTTSYTFLSQLMEQRCFCFNLSLWSTIAQYERDILLLKVALDQHAPNHLEVHRDIYVGQWLLLNASSVPVNANTPFDKNVSSPDDQWNLLRRFYSSRTLLRCSTNSYPMNCTQRCSTDICTPTWSSSNRQDLPKVRNLSSGTRSVKPPTQHSLHVRFLAPDWVNY